MNGIIKRNTNELGFMDDFFDDFFGRPSIRNGNVMRTDIRQVESGYQLDIDVPGFGKDEIRITLENGYLTVEAKKEETNEKKEIHFLRRERFLGSAARSFFVGEDIAEKDIKASYDKGILTLSIPKQGTNVKEKRFISIE